MSKLEQEMRKRLSCSAVELDDGWYSDAYSKDGSKKNWGKCDHSDGATNMMDSLDDGSEMVATIEVCDDCGRVLPPFRVSKCGVNLLALGKMKSRFEMLKKLIG